MDLLLSAALLASFIVAVDLIVGADAGGPAGRLSLLFTSPDQLGWPRGVQETYERMAWNWSRWPRRDADLHIVDRPDPASLTHEIVEYGIDPVPVSRVRRR